MGRGPGGFGTPLTASADDREGKQPDGLEVAQGKRLNAQGIDQFSLTNKLSRELLGDFYPKWSQYVVLLESIIVHQNVKQGAQ